MCNRSRDRRLDERHKAALKRRREVRKINELANEFEEMVTSLFMIEPSPRSQDHNSE